MTTQSRPKHTVATAHETALKLLELAIANSKEAHAQLTTPIGAKTLGKNLAIAYFALNKSLLEGVEE